MYLDIDDVPLVINIILVLLIFLQFLLAIKSIDWPAFFVFRLRQHLVFGSFAVVVCLWQLRGWLDDSASIYMLGVNLMTLILGWAFSSIIVLMASVALVLLGVNSLDGWPLNTFFWGMLPVVISLLIYRLVVYWLDNPFAYIYLCGFFATVLTLVIPAAGLWLLLIMMGHSGSGVLATYLTYAPVICISEGVLSGMLLVSFVIFLPDWVKTYDELRYERNAKDKYK
ncbi:energy-coupling factor ABC transporter permease [Litoribacillus peritrichatus]|uniref:Energy-coupling factor ABC transporter permease n=1 Tax=Litoribacillus peritrichatus TaxID=718191 RepID=A0ABP7LV58_9GAMM